MWAQRKTRIIQIGDLHYPSAAKKPRSIDFKDAGMPGIFKEGLVRPPLAACMEAVIEEVNREPIALLAFMGDLTDVGDLEGFKNCAEYLNRLFDPGSEAAANKTKSIQIVPGNHDVNRDLADDSEPFNKFYPLKNILEKRGFNNFPIDDALHINSDDGNEVVFWTLNSCFGCGSKRRWPESIADIVFDKIMELQSAAGSAETFLAEQFEILDTPAIHSRSLETLRKAISLKEGRPAVHVVSAHHNILPQYETRVAPYSDMLNSGALRQSLLNANAPVIYLHGHIHDDTIEVVRSHDTDSPPLVIVSAPEAVSGFNLLEIQFDVFGRPLGVVVEKYRVRKDGSVQNQASVPIVLRKAQHLSREAEKLLASLSGTARYLSDLNIFSDTTRLLEAVSELSWLGKAEILNPDEPHDAWKVGLVQ